jgi:hypothetical protein
MQKHDQQNWIGSRGVSPERAATGAETLILRNLGSVPCALRQR